MKGYIKNLNGLHIKYIIINLVVATAALVANLVMGDIDLENKINMYISVIMMICILIFFTTGRKRYQSELDKIKKLSFGQKLNNYHAINEKRLKSFTWITALASLGFILSNNILYLVFCALSVILIFLNRSSKTKLCYELNLTKEEVEKIGNTINQDKN